MRKLFFTFLVLLFSDTVFAGSTYVNPHIRSDGTFVQGYFRTTPDSNPYNNYSTRGNINPYTGQEGTVDPYNTIRRKPLYYQNDDYDFDGNSTDW